MKRTTTKTKLGQGQVRHRVRVEDEPCEAGTQEAAIRQVMFLRSLADTPDLLACGYHRFQKLVISHSGLSWIAEAEATVDEVP